MDGSANSDEFFSRNSEGSSSENNAKSNISSAKRHSKTRSKVWEKVAWFTRKTRTGKESKTNSPGESRNVWKSPCLKRSQRNKSESCLKAGEQFAVASCPNTSQNFAKKKTKSSLRKARSFSYLKRKKLGHYNVEAESNKEETKENDNPFRCQTATGTFYDFESTGRRNSGNPSCCSILNEMAREINFEQRGQVRESAKSSLSLPMSLLSIGENPANDLNSTLHSATKQSESRSTRGRMGPMYNSWPRKKRNFRPNNCSEAFSPPLKQKRICNLRKTATFSGFDAHKLGASEDKLWQYRDKAVKSSPVLDNQQNQIKNQNGLTIGVVHVFKTPSNTRFQSRFSHSLNDMKESLVHNTNRSSRDDNLPDSSSPSHFKEIDLGDGLVSHLRSQSCSNFSENNEKWAIEQDTPLSSDLSGCTGTEAVMPVDDLKLSVNDSGKCLENISQKEHSPELLQENLSYKSDKKPCDERNLNLELVPSCKLPITDHQASSMQLEVICEIPDNLSEMEGGNKLSLSNSSSKDLNPQTEIINDAFTSENQVHTMESLDSSICCIKIEDQVTDFSESKHDSQSNLKEIPIITFSEANKEAIDEPLDIVQNTTIKDVGNESSTPPIDCTVVKNQELSDIVLPDSSVSANTATQDEQEDNNKLDASLEVDKSDKESLATSPLSSQLDLADSCHVFDVTSLQLPSENLLKEKQPKVDGTHFKHQTETMLKWFSEFNDEQRNIFIRRLLEQCELPQMHMLSVIMEPALHKTCPPNCQDMLSWLPLSVTETVLLYLDPVSLCRCGLVNRFWNSLVSRPLIWKTLCRSNEWQLSRNSSKIQHAKYTLPDGTVQWKKMFSERFLLRRNWLNGRCKVRTFEGHTQGISCVQFDDTQIVSGSSDKTIKVWDLSRDDSHAVLTLAGHSGTVRCLNLNGNRLVSGSVDRSIKVWDLSFKSYWSGASCKVTMVGHMHTVRCLQVDDEKVVSGSYDKTLKVWDIKTGHCKLTLRGHNAAVLCVQFDDSMIVSGSYDNTIKVWSLKEGECLMTLTGHHDAVTCLNLTQDGRKVISGSLDHNLKFWDLATGKCIGTLDWIRSEGHTGVISLTAGRLSVQEMTRL